MKKASLEKRVKRLESMIMQLTGVEKVKVKKEKSRAWDGKTVPQNSFVTGLALAGAALADRLNHDFVTTVSDSQAYPTNTVTNDFSEYVQRRLGSAVF